MDTAELLDHIISLLAQQRTNSEKEDEVLDHISNVVTEAIDTLREGAA